jgi:hypothetical protein|tara:strand:+ start:450 stop:737 length:288 start_codon:yes stop_codon:yes gene_type:complete
MPRFHNINGTNVQFTADEETARDNEELIYANGAFDRAIADLRQKRNRLLAETDYLALSDNILSSNMTTYRTALRDLTDNLTTVEEVNAVNFPTKP